MGNNPLKCVAIIAGAGLGTEAYAVNGYTNPVDIGRTLFYTYASYVIDFGSGKKEILSCKEVKDKLHSGITIQGLELSLRKHRIGEVEPSGGCVIPIKVRDSAEYHEYYNGYDYAAKEVICDLTMNYRLDTTKDGKYYKLLKEGYKLYSDNISRFGGRVLILKSEEKKKVYILFDCDRAYLDFGFEYCVAKSLSFSKNIDISHRVSLTRFFNGCVIQHLDLRNLDTSKAVRMTMMFKDATIGSMNVIYLNTSSVAHMSGMFMRLNSLKLERAIFRGDESGYRKFYKLLNVPLLLDVSGFNTSRVENLHSIFCDANVKVQGLNAWDVSSVHIMACAFKNTRLGSNSDLSSWDVTSVIDMKYIFEGTTADTIDISLWNIGKELSIGYLTNGQASNIKRFLQT